MVERCTALRLGSPRERARGEQRQVSSVKAQRPLLAFLPAHTRPPGSASHCHVAHAHACRCPWECAEQGDWSKYVQGVQERVLQLGPLQALDLVACLHKRLLPTEVAARLKACLPACLRSSCSCCHCDRNLPAAYIGCGAACCSWKLHPPCSLYVLWEYSRLLAQEQATLDPQYLEAQAQYDAYVKERGTLPERFVNSALLPAELKRRVRRHLGLPACEACAVCPRGSQAGSIVFAWPAQPSTAPAAASGRLPTFYCCRLPSDATLTCDPAHALQPRVTWMGPYARLLPLSQLRSSCSSCRLTRRSTRWQQQSSARAR